MSAIVGMVVFALFVGMIHGDMSYGVLGMMQTGFDIMLDGVDGVHNMIMIGLIGDNNIQENLLPPPIPENTYVEFEIKPITSSEIDVGDSNIDNYNDAIVTIDGTIIKPPEPLPEEYVVNGKVEYFLHVSNGTKKSIYHYYAKAPPCSINVNSKGEEARMMFGFATGIPRSNQLYGNSPDWLRIFDENEAVAMGFSLKPCKYDENGNDLGDGWEDHDGDGYADGFANYTKRGLECMKPYGWLDGWWIRATSLECVYGPPGLDSTIENRQQEILQIEKMFPGSVPDPLLPNNSKKGGVLDEIPTTIMIEPVALSDVSPKADPQITLSDDTPSPSPSQQQPPLPPTLPPAPTSITTNITSSPPSSSPPPTTTTTTTLKPIPRPINYDTATTSTIIRVIHSDTIQIENNVILHLTLVNGPQPGDRLYEQATSYTRKSCPQGTSIIYDIDNGRRIQNTDTDKAVLAWCIGYGTPVQAGPPIPLNELLLSKGLVQLNTKECRASNFGDDEWAQRSGC